MNDPSASPRSGPWIGRLVRDNLLGRIVANAAILVGGKGLNAIFSLLYLAFAVRALGIETFGLLVLVHTYAQAVGEVAKFQSWQAVLRYGTPALGEERIGDFQTLIKFTGLLDLSSGIGGAALAALGCGLAAGLLGWPPELVPAASLYCISIIFMVSATPTGLLRLFDRFDLLAAQSAVGSLIRLVGSAVLFATGGGLTAFLALWFIATACASLALVGFAWRETARRGLFAGINWSFSHLTKPFAGIWRFVWTTNLNTSIAMVSTHLATLLVGGLVGATEAALYRIARQLAEAIAKPTKLLVPAIYPELARLAAEGSIQRMRKLVSRSLAASGLGAVVCFGVICLAGNLLLRLIGGEPAVPAYVLMVMLGAASLIALWTFPLEPLLISVGREGTALQIRFVTTLLYLPLILVLVHVYGLIGAGAAAIAASLFMVGGQTVATIKWFVRQNRSTSVTPEPAAKKAQDTHRLPHEP